jgi:hypothetical protein
MLADAPLVIGQDTLYSRLLLHDILRTGTPIIPINHRGMPYGKHTLYGPLSFGCLHITDSFIHSLSLRYLTTWA